MNVRLIVIVLVATVCVNISDGQERTSVKPPSPSLAGPPPLPLESDVIRYVFEHFPGIDRDAVMKFLGDNFKSDMPEFRKLSNEDAAKATVFLVNLVSEAIALMDIARKDSELAMMMVRHKDLERKAERKAREAALAEGREKDAARAALRVILEQAFDAKQALMKRDLAGMQAELERLDKMILRRSEYRKQIIEKKLNEMTMEENYLKW